MINSRSKIVLKRLFANIVAIGLMLIFTYLSSITSLLSFDWFSSIFPAISGETINTSSRHGLTTTVFNLGFLGFIIALIPLANLVERLSVIRVTAAVIVLFLLTTINGMMFWPGEQLISMAFLILVCTLLFIVSLLLHFIFRLQESTSDNSAIETKSRSTFYLLLVVFGFLLPFIETLRAVFYIYQ